LAILQAAILHDTIEDTDATAAELRKRFGDEVARIVLEVTDDKALPKQRRKELQVEHAPHKSEGAALVKLADKTCNLRDIANSPPHSEKARSAFDSDVSTIYTVGKNDLSMLAERLAEGFGGRYIPARPVGHVS
jgi:guanosine-3',5'-bis(diphosphate) 3'-pyrophosphohydrolase